MSLFKIIGDFYVSIVNLIFEPVDIFKSKVTSIVFLVFAFFGMCLALYHLVTLGVSWMVFALIFAFFTIFSPMKNWFFTIISIASIATGWISLWIIGGPTSPQGFVDTVFALRNLSFLGFIGYWALWYGMLFLGIWVATGFNTDKVIITKDFE